VDIPPSQEPLFPVEPSPPPEQPPAGPPPTPEPAPLEPASWSRLVAPGLALLGAVLTLAGVFLPLYTIRQTYGFDYLSSGEEQTLTTVMTPWRVEFTVPGQGMSNTPSAPLGAPLLLAVMTLLAASGAGAIYVSKRSEGILARRLTFAGVVFLAGVVATIGAEGMTWNFRDDQIRANVSIGLGMWLLILAVPVAAAAAIAGYLRPREPVPAWADPAVAFADTATPPSGIPVQTAEVSITLLPPEPPPADAWAPRREDG